MLISVKTMNILWSLIWRKNLLMKCKNKWVSVKWNNSYKMLKTWKKVLIIPKRWNKNSDHRFTCSIKLLSKTTHFGLNETLMKSHLQIFCWKQQMKSKHILVKLQTFNFNTITAFLYSEANSRAKYQNKTFYWKIFTWWFCLF